MGNNNILFIGAGNMAEAIISGIISSNTYKISQIKTYDINKKRLQYIKKKFNIYNYCFRL
ncbi:NAD(P)-binding domain-containing protein [Candidatus Desantisbacteria bacterium]|nr:NAD(P)-binding domain-containing protein [Candidatus Desantisbacteria bacterium]